MGSSSSMFDSGASMGTSGSSLNMGFAAADAGVDWVSPTGTARIALPEKETDTIG